ncbi:MAG: hypothetical protein MJY82_01435 [Fibrobacter sp.]|nr:hypothetical protein [Fibrobacter sp.]
MSSTTTLQQYRFSETDYNTLDTTRQTQLFDTAIAYIKNRHAEINDACTKVFDDGTKVAGILVFENCASFIEFLGRLTLKKTKEDDWKIYTNFIKTFFPSGYKDAEFDTVPQISDGLDSDNPATFMIRKSLPGVMYRVFRCGLLHRLSLANQILDNTQRILLSECGNPKEDGSNISKADHLLHKNDAGFDAFVLVKEQLVEDIGAAITSISTTNDPELRKWVSINYASMRNITGLKTSTDCTDATVATTEESVSNGSTNQPSLDQPNVSFSGMGPDDINKIIAST